MTNPCHHLQLAHNGERFGLVTVDIGRLQAARCLISSSYSSKSSSRCSVLLLGRCAHDIAPADGGTSGGTSGTGGTPPFIYCQQVLPCRMDSRGEHAAPTCAAPRRYPSCVKCKVMDSCDLLQTLHVPFALQGI
jgi:hypothetical protein